MDNNNKIILHIVFDGILFDGITPHFDKMDGYENIYLLNVYGEVPSFKYIKDSAKDKSRVPLFGDCGVAMALECDVKASDIIIEFNTLGSGYKALMTPHGGYRHPVTKENSFVEEDFGNGIIRSPKDALINGMDVFSFAITRPPKSVSQFMEREGIDKDTDVDYFLIHQANKLIVDRIVKKLKLNPEKVPYNLQEFGNLGGASIPMLMATEIAEELKTRPLTLICSSFGLGLTWGTMVLKTKAAIVLPISYV